MQHRISRASALALFTLPALIIGVARSEAQQSIRIGATMAQTGTLATQGGPASNGYQLCQKHVNEKGGLLGRKIEFLIYDDKSDGKLASDLYEKLITEDKVDAVMGPYGSTHTEAVADVIEKHRKVHIAPLSATTSIWEKGRRYIFMQLPPADLFLAGLIDIGADKGLKTVAIIQEDALFPKAAGKAAVERAKNKGMEVVLHETYAKGTKDFSPILAKIKAAKIDVFGIAASSLGDFIIVARQMQEQDINLKMFGNTGAVAEFGKELGKTAEFVYGLSAWEPSLPYPGVKEFVAAYEKEFNKPPSFHAAGAYAGCQLFMEAARLAGSLDSDKLREQLLKLKTKTIFADYAVDERGFQTANNGLFVQWQDGAKVVVWPAELASAKVRFPTPEWNQR